MAEEGAFIPDIDGRLAESGFEVTPEQNPKKKRRRKGKGRNYPRQPRKKQPIDSRSRGPKEVDELATVPEQEEEFVLDGEYLNNQVMLKTGDRRLRIQCQRVTQELQHTWCLT